MEGKPGRAATCSSSILMVFGGFLCALVNMFLECSVKKNHLSNLNPVKKKFTCCLHLAGGALNSGGNQDVILLSLNAPHTQKKCIVAKDSPPAAFMNTSTT